MKHWECTSLQDTSEQQSSFPLVITAEWEPASRVLRLHCSYVRHTLSVSGGSAGSESISQPPPHGYYSEVIKAAESWGNKIWAKKMLSCSTWGASKRHPTSFWMPRAGRNPLGQVWVPSIAKVKKQTLAFVIQLCNIQSIFWLIFWNTYRTYSYLY